MNIREASNIYLGLAAISEVYYGSTKLWPINFANNYFTATNISENAGFWKIRIPVAVTETMIPSISYSTDNGDNWTTVNNDTSKSDYLDINILVGAGKSVLIKSNSTQWGTTYSTFADNTRMWPGTAGTLWTVSGNIMSLVYGDNFIGQTSFPNNNEYWFTALFAYNNYVINPLLVDASNLVLPATNVPASAYRIMFYNRTALTGAPDLTAATTTSNNVYTQMFDGCESLVTPPELPSLTTLPTGVYAYMFRNCTSLTETPELDFSNVTTFNSNACLEMFMNDTSLETINGDIIVANNSANSYNVFKEMFKACTSLEETCEIGLSSTANQTSNYFTSMFEDCTSLNKIYISSSWTAPVSDTFTSNWVKNVASTGTFYDNTANTIWNTFGDSYIPTGWARVPEFVDYSSQYFTVEFTDKVARTVTFWTDRGNEAGMLSLEVSGDNGTNWQSIKGYYASSSATTYTYPKVRITSSKFIFRGTINNWYYNINGNSANYQPINMSVSTADMSATANVYGNVMSLYAGDNFTTYSVPSEVPLPSGSSQISGTSSAKYMFAKLFRHTNATSSSTSQNGIYFNIVSAENLILPCDTNGTTTFTYDYMFRNMFENQKELRIPPTLNMNRFQDYSCQNMFSNCTNLQKMAPMPNYISNTSSAFNNMYNGTPFANEAIPPIN